MTHELKAEILKSILAAVCLVMLAGCTTRHYTVNQYGWNHVDAEVLKEMDLTPTVKASLK